MAEVSESIERRILLKLERRGIITEDDLFRWSGLTRRDWIVVVARLIRRGLVVEVDGGYALASEREEEAAS